MSRKQKRVIGSVVKIALDEQSHVYGRVLVEPLVAFYDTLTSNDLNVEEIIGLPILFQISVMNYAIKSGRWPIVGLVELESALLNPPPRFKQDPINRDRFWLYYEDGREIPCSKEDCIGLERLAIWDPEHVEDRLRDYYAGRPNKWLESLRILD